MKIGRKQCLYVVIWISLIQGFIADYFGLGVINYICDLLLLLCCLIRLTNSKWMQFTIKKHTGLINISLFAFCMIIIIGWIINGAPLIHALWGMRNYGRFFLFYYLCIELFNQVDYERITNWLIRLFLVHCAIVLFQIGIEHLSYDFLGGIFGKYQGCASGLMIYYGLIIIILFAKYDNKEVGISRLLIYLGIILGTAALAELKALFIYFIIVLIMYGLLSNNKIKASIVLMLGIIGAFIGIQVLIEFFPEFADFFTVEKLIYNLTNKTANYTYVEGLDVGRSSVFYKLDPIVKQWGGNVARWVGLGLGNGDYSSSFNFLNSSFYNTYPRSNYMNFSLSFLFVETGYLGTIAYVAFFVANEIVAMKNYIENNNSATLIGVLLPLMCWFLIYYNASLRTNYAYIVFALLASIPGYTKKRNNAMI